MNIRNRTPDVVGLRCHICQDFIKMIAVENWRTILYPFIKRTIEGPYKAGYIEQYKIIRKKGIENYSFDDMDVPFIVNILRFCPKIATPTKDTITALDHIKKDRNITDHSSENESEEELYLRALISLKNLQNFLHVVDFNETTISDEKRHHYVKKYSKDIDSLKFEIYNDCIEMFQIKKDIQEILSSENQCDTFRELYNSYNSKAHMSDKNKEQLRRFVIESSNAGIKNSHAFAAIYYFHDLDEAMHRYEMMIEDAENLSPYEARQLIDFVNQAYITGKQPTERMLQFVKMIESQGFDIETTPNGIIWNKKSPRKT